MALYNSILTRSAASLTLGVGSVECPATGMRRFRLYEYVVSSNSSADDNTIQVETYFTSTGSTGTGVTPAKLNSADAAAVTVSKKEITVNGTAGDLIDSVAINQRGLYRWFAMPDKEIVVPATASYGLIFRTPVADNLPKIILIAKFEEL